MDWQPIETAPKDGCFVGAWLDGNRWRFAQVFEQDGDFVDVHSDTFRPCTRWAPLPALPNAKQASEDKEGGMKTRYYPKGTIVLFEEGEYSDFGYCGQVVTLTDLDLDKAARDWRLALGKDEKGDWVADDWDHGTGEFVAHLIASQICAPLDCHTVHIGSYGMLSIGEEMGAPPNTKE